MRLTVVGKGGSGKSTIAGLISALLAEEGETVLVLDADPAPGLPQVLGIDTGDTPMLAKAGERKDRQPWAPGMSALEMVERFSVPGPHGLRFLQYGKISHEFGRDLSNSFTAFYRTFRAFDRPGWWVIADLAAGTLQPSYGFTGGSGAALLVTEPSQKSWLTTRRVAEILRFWGATPLGVPNKVASREESEWVAAQFAAIGVPVWEEVPADPAVAEAERKAVPLVLLNKDTPVMKAARSMVSKLKASYPGAARPAPQETPGLIPDLSK